MKGSWGALITLCGLALLLFLASPHAAAQLPPAIQADRLLVRAEREIQEGDYAAAAASLEQIVQMQDEHGMEVPEAFWFKRGQVAQEAGLYQRAVESTIRYLEIAGQQGEHYRAALELLDAAEQVRKMAEAAETLSRLAPDLEMVVIPSGSFRMGCYESLFCGSVYPDIFYESELPVHEVSIQSFALSKHEVTFVQWDACVAAGGCGGYRPNDEGWGRGERPVINVSWEDAQSFVAWLSEVTELAYRLPTEAEWEYAARAGSVTKYHFGNDESQLCRYANHADRDTRFDWRNTACSDGVGDQTARVGRYEPNEFGLYDMHGNVWEWVQDC